MGFFKIGSRELFGLLQTTILLIPASCVTSIIGVSHWHPDEIVNCFGSLDWVVKGNLGLILLDDFELLETMLVFKSFHVRGREGMKSFLLTAFSFYRPRLRHHQEEVGLGTI
jgi:hypothetical protein